MSLNVVQLDDLERRDLDRRIIFTLRVPGDWCATNSLPEVVVLLLAVMTGGLVQGAPCLENLVTPPVLVLRYLFITLM
eukprot:4638938-Amphidinium_carterae.1